MFKFAPAKNQIAFLVVLSVLCNNLLGSHGETNEDALSAPPVHCPYHCTEPYEPICGSDGKTYGNICHLNTKNMCDNTRIRKVSNGTCPRQRCVPDSHPITCFCHDPFPTACFSSAPPHRPVSCSNVNRPVCGTNGITYRNACLLAFNTACLGYPVRVCHNGRCPPIPADTDEE